MMTVIGAQLGGLIAAVVSRPLFSSGPEVLHYRPFTDGPRCCPVQLLRWSGVLHLHGHQLMTLLDITPWLTGITYN